MEVRRSPNGDAVDADDDVVDGDVLISDRHGQHGEQPDPAPVPPQGDPAHFVFFGRLAAHYTHRMASSGGLRLHFCTRCGAWGQLRSVKLKDMCKPPTAAGLYALRRIAEGKTPTTGR